MKRVGAEEIRKLDLSAARDYSMPGLLLMENAGRSISEIIARDFKPCKVLIFVGKGNNGSDGLVVARHLTNRGYSVQIVLLEDPARLKPDPLINFTIVRKMGVPCDRVGDSASTEDLVEYCRHAELIVDAIFGVGLHSPVIGIFEKAIESINQSRQAEKEMKGSVVTPVLSVDIPSGLDADTGRVQGVAVMATRTVTLALPKVGLFEGEGPRYAGEIEVADIGLPRELLFPFLSA